MSNFEPTRTPGPLRHAVITSMWRSGRETVHLRTDQKSLMRGDLHQQ
jgi:hypothetical protein